MAPRDDLGLVETVDRVGESVVIAIAHTADGGLDARLAEALGLADADMSKPSRNICRQTLRAP